MRLLKRSLVFAALVLLIGAAGSAQAAPFTDKNLEAAVRAVLQNTKAELTDQLLNNVYVLDASGKQIASLAGLEKCKNLAQFKATNNQISDLKPLKDLTNIQSLDLANNKIVDMTPLAGLTKLQYLELSNNQVADLKPLAALPAITLAVPQRQQDRRRRARSPSSPGWPRCRWARTRSRTSAPLATVTKLTVLDLNDNQIVDMAPLAKQTELSLLMLERNKIADLTPLVGMAKADAEGARRFAPYLRLYLAGNPLSDAAKTTQLMALKGFGVRLES